MPLTALDPYDHYVYALAAMLGTLLAVVVVMWLVSTSRWKGKLHELKGVAPPFINVLGVLFGLTLAFIANDTWSAHDKAAAAVYHEADALHSLMTISSQLEDPVRTSLQGAIKRYAQASAAEWSDLALRRPSAQADERAGQLLGVSLDKHLEEALGHNAHALLLQKVVDIRHARDERIGLSRTHVNPLKWLGMAFLGLLTLLSIAVVHVDNPKAVQVSITLFALASAPTAAIVLIQGNPFLQPSFVSPDPILAAVR